MDGPQPDAVERIAAQWQAVRPDVDVTPLLVIGRVSRLSRLLDRRLAVNFARHGLENWMYDVLATLRRSGQPYRLTAGELVRQTMVTTGAITNRVDRLERLGLVTRSVGSDRRQVHVSLTEAGVALVDEVLVTHLETERDILRALPADRQDELATLLRALLVELGDGVQPPPG